MTLIKKAALTLFIILTLPSLWAQNRFALVIGNAEYPRVDDRLPNAINDTNDISAALRGLGYDVVLRQNLQYLDMVREIGNFTTRLKNNRNSEGFFWYAGHAMEIGGENLLLPLNVDLENDNLIRATSFSVTNLTIQLDDARNKVNVVVLDACRTPPSAGGSRSFGDASRVIKTVPNVPADLLMIYSTASGTVVYDGEGKRNSPFTEAFLNNINSTEPLTLMVSHVITGTMNLTNQRQRPFTGGSMGSENAYYSLNPAGRQPVSIVPVDFFGYKIVDGKSVTIIGITSDDIAYANLTIPALIERLPVTSIGDYAISGFNSLNSITIPSSVTSIGIGSFYNCASLTGVNIASSVISIGDKAFGYCWSLTSINIPSSVTSIGKDAFYGCSSLTSVTLSRRTQVGQDAFPATARITYSD